MCDDTLKDNRVLAKFASYYINRTACLKTRLDGTGEQSVSVSEASILKVSVENAEKRNVDLRNLCDKIAAEKVNMECRLGELERNALAAEGSAQMKINSCEDSIKSLTKQLEILEGEKNDDADRLNKALLEKQALENDLNEEKERSATETLQHS